MTFLTPQLRQQYVRQLFAVAVDLAAMEFTPPRRPIFRLLGRRGWQVMFWYYLNVFRLVSRMAGVEREFMALFRETQKSIRPSDGREVQ